MSNPTWIHGRISIDPPLPWSEIKNSPYLKANARKCGIWPDALLEVVETLVSTPDGELYRREAVAIIADEGETSARTLLTDVDNIVKAYPGHTFAGYFQCEGEENDDIWRVVIRKGRAIRIDAQIVWPEGSE